MAEQNALLLIWNDQKPPSADDHVDELVSDLLAYKPPRWYVCNATVVDALRVQRKRGNLTALTLRYDGVDYPVDADGRFSNGTPPYGEIGVKYLAELL